MKNSILFLCTFFIAINTINAQKKLEFTIPFPRLETLLIKYKGEVVGGKANGLGEAYNANDKKEKVYQGNWKDNQFDGFGRYWVEYAFHTDFYFGDFKEGKKSGKGTMYSKDERLNNISYEGNWQNDLRNGQGIEKTYVGTYDGNWKNDKKSGKGKITFNSSIYSYYDGNWENDKINNGAMKYANGDFYEGDWKNEYRDGKGKQTYSNGDSYDGEWSKDKKNGTGSFYYASGDIYTGSFEENQILGEGILKFKNGDIYTGNFSAGKYNGKGKMVYADGKIEDGNWDYGRFQNQFGTKKYGNGEYTGEIVEGFPQGKGKMIFSDGRIYEGDFDNKTINGNGKMTMPGYIFEGKWKNGHMTNGSRSSDKGNIYYGNFENDKFQDEKGVLVWSSGNRLEAPFADGKQVKGEGKYTEKDTGCIITGIFENYKPAGTMNYNSKCNSPALDEAFNNLK